MNIKTNEKPVAMKLKLTLVAEYLNDDEKDALAKFGDVTDAISRTFIVPAGMSLHALHFAIMRAFGWTNSHLHHFLLPEETVKLMTSGNNLERWSDLCGIYFRFPSEHPDDYWDDDYKRGENPKIWMRAKYHGPYIYPAYSEHFIACQNEARVLRMEFDEVEVYETFQEMYERHRKTGEKDGPHFKGKKAFSDATIEELESHVTFESSFYELLERLTVSDLLCPTITPANFSKDKWIWESESYSFDQLVETWKGMADIYSPDLMLRFMRIAADYQSRYYRFMKTHRKSKGLTQAKHAFKEVIDSTNIAPVPVTSELLYEYDYGDGWQVKITCEKVYEERDLKSDEQVRAVYEKQRPICTEADGLSVMDDCGGIHGYIHDLRLMKDPVMKREFMLNESPDSVDNPEYIKNWAQGQGWTGRKVKSENLI